jgi:hypothetical protein
MRNFVTVVFAETGTAYAGLRALWQLDANGEVTVHGTAVVHRDARGHFKVDTKETYPVFATAWLVHRLRAWKFRDKEALLFEKRSKNFYD